MMMGPSLNPDFYQEYMQLLTELTVKFYHVLAETETDCLGIQRNIANSYNNPK
jgi:uroporphyrinogen decarboxylase